MFAHASFSRILSDSDASRKLQNRRKSSKEACGTQLATVVSRAAKLPITGPVQPKENV